jgi:AraC-like DNA-binding protein
VIEKTQTRTMSYLRDIELERLVDSQFLDVDDLMSTVRHWDLDFRPLTRPTEAAVGHIVQSSLGSIGIGYARFSASLEQLGAAPRQRTTFIIMETGMRRLYWRGHDVDRETVLVYADGSEISCFSGGDFEIHALSLDDGTIAEACEALEVDVPPRQLHAELFEAPTHWLARARQALCEFRLGRRQPYPAVVHDLILDLVAMWVGGPTERTAPRQRDKALQKSLEIIRELGPPPAGTLQLAQMAGVSTRTLEYAFRERFGLTPAAFLKARRLAAVRRDLQAADPDRTTVSDVLASHNFWHIGQFATDYRRAFGQLPSETLLGSHEPRKLDL